MKIMTLIDRPNLYGSEIHTLDILTKLKEKNYELTLISLRDGPLLKKMASLNIRYYIFNMSWMLFCANFIKLLCFIRKENPNILHCHQPKALFFGVIIGLILRIPVVITVHSQPYDHSRLKKNMLMRYVVYCFHSFIHTFSCCFSSRIIYVSKNMFNESRYKGKATFISNWLPSSLEEYDGGGRELSSKNINIKFISVGSVTKSKGIDLLYSFFELLESHSNIKYQVSIFGGIQEESIKGLNNKNIRLNGYSDNIYSELKKADFFILLSRSETFGLSYLEAMYFGLPVICLDLENLNEIIPTCNIKVDKDDINSGVLKFLEFISTNVYCDVSKENYLHSKSFNCDESICEIERIYSLIKRSE
ncbi:glycosyltransferase family 4 protein [Photobacterium leiognathi]|uniref:glycosyltransferase family 4 protein n=1 Tax=Photobacterium leiognathi TaxID=553611 RepID=UPI00298290BF|nr:glycosyltransferase family 4 protein [Photobacterium leiognathi]